MLLKKFSNYQPEELFDLLAQNVEHKSYPDLFIAIATVLELPEKQAEIIMKLE